MRQLTEQQCKDVLITAIEGGISYWSYLNAYNPQAGTATIQEVKDDETYPEHKVTTRTIRTGYRRCENADPQTNGELIEIAVRALTDAADAGDADAILQMGLFNEIRYA